MTQQNDIRFEKLRALSYTGALADMLAAYKFDNGIISWPQWYPDQGYSQPHVSDRAMAFWEGLVVP